MDKNSLRRVYSHPLLTENDLDTIFDAHSKVTFCKGEFWLREGQTAHEYLIIGNGLMRSYVHDFNGREITIQFFGRKEIAIEVSSLFQRIPTQENIQALTDCTCWKIAFDDFQHLFHSIAGFSEWGRSWMAKSLFECKQRSVAIITESATARYHKLLSGKPEVLQHAPLKQIASYLGITDTSLSRIRKGTAKS